MNETIKVTEEAFAQYQEIQRIGTYNMLNKSGVQRTAMNYGFHELVAFIEGGDYYEIPMNYEKYESMYGDE